MTVHVYWPDGGVTRADDATGALQTIAEKQWDQPMSVKDVKRLLAERAYGWNNAVVNPELSDVEFLRALGKTGMVFVTESALDV